MNRADRNTRQAESDAAGAAVDAAAPAAAAAAVTPAKDVGDLIVEAMGW
jgi:hypothetical protein